jgi:methylmalonyl-CoA mutase
VIADAADQLIQKLNARLGHSEAAYSKRHGR